ncbi:MAG: HAMP domain-containing histidine kinase [Chloroflexi bacterium]|nr:HAMP domain-containing histidine kinase [Chloroflexota bacterium]
MKKFKRPKIVALAVRLTITMVAVSVLPLALIALIILLGVRISEADRRSLELNNQLELYVAFAEQLIASDGDLQSASNILLSRPVGSGDGAIRVFGSAGQIFGANGSNSAFPSRAAASQFVTSIPTVFVAETRGRRYVAGQVRWQQKVVGVIEVSQSVEDEDRLLRVLIRFVFISIGLAFAAAFLGSSLVARWLARMIGQLRETAEQVANGDLTERALERGPAEFVQLARSINTMTDQLAERLSRIEQQSEAQRRFYRDVSHELRTPMMALGGYLENIEDSENADEQAQSIRAMQAEIARLARLADELLRSDAQPSLTLGPKQTLDLGAMIHELVQNLSGRAQRSGVELLAQVPPRPIAVEADRDRLKQALLNLFDNALRATPPGGQISMRVSLTADQVVIDVQDTGEGIPTALCEAIWERGVRGAEGGSGLGLAIVRTILRAHGGEALLIPSEQGAHIQLRLPIDG